VRRPSTCSRWCGLVAKRERTVQSARRRNAESPRPLEYWREFRASLVFAFALLLFAVVFGCGPKQRCVREFLFVDYPNGEPDTVYATHCTLVNVH
jgi:hypothetical protein